MMRSPLSEGPSLPSSPMKEGYGGDQQAHSDYIRQQADAFHRTSKAAIVSLGTIWKDMDVDFEEQRQELSAINARSLGIWSEAVEDARERREAMRDRVKDGVTEIARIKEQLGDDPIGLGIEAEVAHLHLQDVEPSANGKTLKMVFDEVDTKLHYWRERRAERVQEYEALQAQVRTGRNQLGLATLPSSAMPDVSRANLEFLKLELEKLAVEKERRYGRLATLIEKLKGICSELGEDDKFAASDVHPSLAHVWDRESHVVLDSVYKLAGGQGSSKTGLQIDMSDDTFHRLGCKIEDMLHLKAMREAHAQELMQVLHSLWNALDVPTDEMERGIHVRLMEGPYRLHQKSLEKCMAEVNRLEGCKAEFMHQLITSKSRELNEMCAATRLAVPSLAQLGMDTMHKEPGQMADVLTKLLRMMAEVQTVSAKRMNLIEGITELEEVRAEADWLAAYEVDEQRYKGRDANRKLQRAIRAGKQRDRMQGLADAVREALQEWRMTEGTAFLFDGRDYGATDLVAVDEQLQVIAMEKAFKASGGSRRAAAAAAANSPSNNGRPNTAQTGGNRTPVPKASQRPSGTTSGSVTPRSGAVTPRGLQQRRSINLVSRDIRVNSLNRSGQYFAAPSPVEVRRPTGESISGNVTPPPASTNGEWSSGGGSGTPTSTAGGASYNPLADKLTQILMESPKHAVATLQSRTLPPSSSTPSSPMRPTLTYTTPPPGPNTGSNFAAYHNTPSPEAMDIYHGALRSSSAVQAAKAAPVFPPSDSRTASDQMRSASKIPRPL